MRLQYFDGLIDIWSTDCTGRYLSGNNSVWINIEGGMLAVEMNDKILLQPVLTRDSHCNNKNIFLPKIFELHLTFGNIQIEIFNWNCEMWQTWVCIREQIFWFDSINKRYLTFICKQFVCVEFHQPMLIQFSTSWHFFCQQESYSYDFVDLVRWASWKMIIIIMSSC